MLAITNGPVNLTSTAIHANYFMLATAIKVLYCAKINKQNAKVSYIYMQKTLYISYGITDYFS